MSTRTLRGKVAIAGVGETPYYRHGKAPVSEFKLALQAILAACEDAGIDPRRIDGFASYSNDRNDPSRLAAALGLPALRFSNMNWGGGGGGGSAATGNAAAAVACGMANCVVVFRALAQGQFQRFGAAPPGGTATGEAALNAPYGVMSPAQRYAMRAMRFLHENRIEPSAQRAIALASYHHAQANPRAVMHGRPLTARGLRRLALDRRTLAPVRLLPGERRRGGADRGAGRGGARLPPAAGLPAGLGAGLGVSQRRARPQRAALRHLELHHRGAAALRHGGRRSPPTSTWCRATRTSPAAC